MKYEEALKQVTTAKPQDNFMVVEFDYSTKYLLPYKDGVTLISCFANAEQLSEDYGKPKRILELERSAVSSRVMSRQEYQRFKIAALLGISPDEVKEAEKVSQQ